MATMLTKYHYPPAGELLGIADLKHQLYCRILSAVAKVQGYTEAADALTKFGYGAIDYTLWDRCMREDQHEIAGFVRHVRTQLPQHANRIYIGLTSSDLMDTFDAMVWARYWPHLSKDVYSLIESWYNIDDEHWRLARTHGRDTQEWVRANKMYQRAARDLLEATNHIDKMPLRANLSGPTGSFSTFLTFDQAKQVADDLHLKLDLYSTQTADRFRYADLAFQLTQIIGVVEQIATLHRLGSITGVDEYSEGRTEGQKGSSSMPHKTNPISAEQVCGLSRLARSNLSALLETWRTQWWERDLTNSSVERLAWADLLHLTGYIVRTAASWEIDQNLTSGISQVKARPPRAPEHPIPFYELNYRILADEDVETVYRDIQARRG